MSNDSFRLASDRRKRCELHWTWGRPNGAEMASPPRFPCVFFFSFHFSLSAQLQLAANCGGCKRENSGAVRAAGNFLGQLKASPKHGRTNLLSIHVSAVALMSALTFTLKRIRVWHTWQLFFSRLWRLTVPLPDIRTYPFTVTNDDQLPSF